MRHARKHPSKNNSNNTDKRVPCEPAHEEIECGIHESYNQADKDFQPSNTRARQPECSLQDGHAGRVWWEVMRNIHALRLEHAVRVTHIAGCERMLPGIPILQPGVLHTPGEHEEHHAEHDEPCDKPIGIITRIPGSSLKDAQAPPITEDHEWEETPPCHGQVEETEDDEEDARHGEPGEEAHAQQGETRLPLRGLWEDEEAETERCKEEDDHVHDNHTFFTHSLHSFLGEVEWLPASV